MAQGKRYKFQGSSFLVSTAYAAGKTITAITQANPAVVSAAAHGFATNDVVLIENLNGMTELNGNLYVIDVLTGGTFSLRSVDATAYSAFSDGSPPTATASKATMTPFCELTGLNKQGGTTEEIEVTTICSTSKEFETGLPDAGSLQLDFNFAPLQVVQTALRNAATSGDDMAFKVVLPGDGGSVTMLGNVQQASFSGAVNGVWTGSVTIKLTGDEEVAEAA